MNETGLDIIWEVIAKIGLTFVLTGGTILILLFIVQLWRGDL